MVQNLPKGSRSNDIYFLRYPEFQCYLELCSLCLISLSIIQTAVTNFLPLCRLRCANLGPQIYVPNPTLFIVLKWLVISEIMKHVHGIHDNTHTLKMKISIRFCYISYSKTYNTHTNLHWRGRLTNHQRITCNRLYIYIYIFLLLVNSKDIDRNINKLKTKQFSQPIWKVKSETRDMCVYVFVYLYKYMSRCISTNHF